jgi:hypothetical protein
MDLKFKSQNLFFHLSVFESWEIIGKKREGWEVGWLILISSLDSLSYREKNKDKSLKKFCYIV